MARTDADMTQGTIWRHLVSFAVPMMIGMLFQQFYKTVDMIVVGQFVSEEALAAVGSTGSITNMLVSLCNGLSMGASVVISQAYGAKDFKRLHTAVHTTVAVTFVLCVISTILGLVIAKPMLVAMDTPENVMPEAYSYLSIYFSGISGLLIYNMGSGILRAVGDSRRPQYFLICSALMNIVLDLLFVLAFGMGVEGVALATLISQGVSAVLILLTLTHEKGHYGLRWKELHINMPELKVILGIGMPSGIQQGITSFSNVFVQGYINAFGSAAMAGWSSYNKLDAILFVPAMCIANASTTFVGQNWGAKKPERARAGVKQSLGMALGITVIMSIIMEIFAPQFMLLFSSEPEVIDYGVRFLRIITPFYVGTCFNQVFGGALRGIGNARAPMIIFLWSFVAFRQLYLFVSTSLGGGFVAVALAYPMGWLMSSALLTIVYLRSKLFKPEAEIQRKNKALS